MSVRATPWKPEKYKNRFEVDIRFVQPDGEKVREKKIVETTTERQAQRWGEAREAQLRSGSLVVKPKGVPTLAEFYPRFVAHGEGEIEKASSVDSKRGVYKNWLGPAFGHLTLDQILDVKVSELRTAMVRKGRKPKTVNNVLSPLNSCLKLAVQWKIISVMPCTITIGAISDALPGFYDFDEYVRLCEGGAKAGSRELVVVRLGGEAGLRRGEMMALRQIDCDFRRRQVHIEQAYWKMSARKAKELGVPEWYLGKPKGGRGRVVPMTIALHDALQAHRHLRGEYVLCEEDGSHVPGHILRDWLEAAQRRAGLLVAGALHKLRHTFCSHLAMKAAPAKAIQELAGHTDLKQTMRYMHLSPSTLDDAIALLDAPTESTVKAAR